MTIADLMQQIEETERLIAVYRNADEVIVGTKDEIYSRRGLINRITLTAAEIGDHLRCRARATARRVAGRAPEARPRILRGKGRSSHRAARAPDATPGPLLRSAKI
jgi:hypothetical protein